MPQKAIDHLIINSPYKEPSHHWFYDRETRLFDLKDGRRPAGYVTATPGSTSFDDPGIFFPLPLVNQIRPRIKAWREAGYPGVTGITKRLLEHWHDPEAREGKRLFFCQLEAIETLIWLCEASPAERQGIEIPGDSGEFTRLCSKMATGSGKTIVMAMLIAWQILNKVAYPQDRRFSKYIFVVAPGLTVKQRLEVLKLTGAGNYYEEFNVIPPGLHDKLRQGQVLIRNWHALNWETEERIAKKKGVDKRGAKSDEAYVREVLGEMANARNILVINDEAHHAWRVAPESKVKGVKKEEIEEATKWVGGLDRIHKTRGILSCYDFSATPFAPTGKRSEEETLFGWIVSDFGLNDAIESGLVKTPRIVVRDNALPDAQYRSRLYHIYMDHEVKDNLNRKAEEHEPLPDLVRTAYILLGEDWREAKKRWEAEGQRTPPVMISVANRTETAARIKYAFDHQRIPIQELSEADRILHIDSKVLEKAEEQEEPVSIDADVDEEEAESADENGGPKRKRTQKEVAEDLRQKVDTVGQEGKPGEKIQNVISVGMLSEGWDAKTVTHIMGLRAFTSQLLCEQVVGRGLRRTSYEVNKETGLFDADYVNIFGVPFTFLPHEESEETARTPPSPKTKIEPVPEKQGFEISWPNVIRVDHVLRPRLRLDKSKLKPLALDAAGTIELAQLAPIIEGKPDVTKIKEIDLEKLGQRQRLQTIVFHAAREVYEQTRPNWKGNREFLLAQVIGLVEEFLRSGYIQITPPLFNQDPVRRRILLTLNMNKLVHHIWDAIDSENTEEIVPIFDTEQPIRSTDGMRTWYTGKPCDYTQRSHINHCVFDSTWEASEAFELDRNKNVAAWVKNDHLWFEIFYTYGGVVRKYRPDFLIRLANGKTLVLEVKGQDSPENQAKRKALAEWCEAVNGHGGFGRWGWDVSRNPSDIAEILERAGAPESKSRGNPPKIA